MSVSSTTNRVNYTGNGTVDTFDYTFRIFKETDLLVTVTNTSTNIETTLTIATDYTVTGVLENSGGTVVLVNASQAWLDADGDLDTGYTITIRRQVEIIQETDIRNQGDFFPEVHEDAFDYGRMIDQQQQDEIDRSVKNPESVLSSTFDPTLPVGIATPNIAVVTNSSGTAFVVGPTTDEISNAQQYALDASASSLLAEQWASLTTGIVNSEDYSSKEFAQGSQAGTGGSAKNWAIQVGTDVTGASAGDMSSREWAVGTLGRGVANEGSSKDWATYLLGTVDDTEYSAKEWAQGSQTRSASGGGSSKDWANYIGGTVDDSEFSAKKYAQDAATSASQAATAAASSQWSDVVYITNAESPVAITDASAGTLYSVDTSGGPVVFNLPAISGLTLSNAWVFGIKKTTADSNNIQVNPDGTDTISGAANKIIFRQNAGSNFIPDVDATPDKWTTIDFGEVPITGDIVGTTDTQTLSNKTLSIPRISNYALFAEQSSTPLTPSAGQKALYPKDDGKLYTLDDEGNEIEVGSGGGSGALNYIDNNDFETGLDDYSTDDGVGGSSAGLSLSLTTVAGELLAGTQSLKITKDAADRDGHFVKVQSLTINPADRGRQLFGSFEFRNLTGYVSGDLIVEVYDVTNSAVLYSGQTDDLELLATKSKFNFATYTEETTEQVELRLKVNNTNTNTFECVVDDVTFGPVATLLVNNSREIVSIQGSESAPTNVDTSYQPLTSTLDTKNGLLADRYVFQNSGVFMIVGKAVFGNSNAGFRSFNYQINGGSQVTPLSAPGNTSTGTVMAVNDIIEVSQGDEINFIARQATGSTESVSMDITLMQISEPSTNTLTNNQLSLQTQKASIHLSSNQTISSTSETTVIFDTVLFDDFGLADTSLGVIDIALAGYYKLKCAVNMTAISGLEQMVVRLRVNGVAVARAVSRASNVTGDVFELVSKTLKLESGDRISVTVDSASDSSYLVRGDATNSYLEIVQIPDFTLYGAVRERDRFQAKFLQADVTTNGVLADLTFNNLVVGKYYTISGLLTSNRSASTLDNITLEGFHDGSTVAYGITSIETSGATMTAAIQGYFKATTTSLTFESVSVSPNSTIIGNGTIRGTYIKLKEENNVIETDAF